MLHYKTYTHDTSEEWVTFIHGAGGSSSIWFKQLKEFKKTFNVLLIDLRGHGNSKSLGLSTISKYTFRTITKDVVEVIDHLKIKSSHFVGISLGTIIIRELAEIVPTKVSSMIMGGAILKMNFRSQILMRMGFFLRSIVPYILLYKLFAFIIMPRKKHKESRNLFVREAKKLYQKEFIRWFGLTTTVNPILRLFRSKDPGIPTLYVMGDEDYMFLPPVKMTVSKHTSAELEVIPECGHVVNVEKPTVFNSVVINWIRDKSNYK
ncbi:MAG: alpha/beta hydrolase [Saprospiraceae bacterium]|nr:alpha/beta hydrolase [Saprospiraceae bacterium]